MTQPEQLSLFAPTLKQSGADGIIPLVNTRFSEMGTFKDSLRAPVHSWFRYPAGFSYKFVEMVFNETHIDTDSWIYDPFSGSGTTLICAKQRGINGYGVEAHSFVHSVADVKLFWEYDLTRFYHDLEHAVLACRAEVASLSQADYPSDVFPELVHKCYHPQDLNELYRVREFINRFDGDSHLQGFLKLALTDTLRGAAAAGTGWPYIAPRKNKGDKPPKRALHLFEMTVWKMYRDVLAVAQSKSQSTICNVLGDSRQKQGLVDGQIDIALTSPPYLNNFDYADRTRLETYFWGITHNWREITQQFRDKLIVAATTQVIRKQQSVETALSQEIRNLDPNLYETIQGAVMQLAGLRLTKGGKKDYDLMTALYFNDMLPILRETHRVLRADGRFYLVLGDSAPYGVHIATDDLIGNLGLALGFRKFEYIPFRTRGDKWKANPQRHRVPLREGVVILTK